MKPYTMILVLFLLSVAFSASAQEFNDDPLEHLVGNWDVTGIVHGEQSKQVIEAQWVLNHQFLRVNEKSIENVSGKAFPFEAIYYFGYDHAANHYVIHLLTVWGADLDVLGIGERRDNELTVSFPFSQGAITNRFTWRNDSKSWRIVIQESKGQRPPYVDLEATIPKAAH